jgi:hypothetical protein
VTPPTRHVPLKVSRELAIAARRRHRPVPDLEQPQLLWVPFEPTSLRPALDPVDPLSTLRPVPFEEWVDGPPSSPPEANWLESVTTEAVYAPFWSFRGKKGGQLLLDGRDGQPVWSTLKADHHATLLRLLLLLSVAFCVGGITLALPRALTRPLNEALRTFPRAQVLVSMTFIGLIALWTSRQFLAVVVPALESGVVDLVTHRIPRTEAKEVRRLLFTPAWILGSIAILTLVNLALAGRISLVQWTGLLVVLGALALNLRIAGQAPEQVTRPDDPIPKDSEWGRRLAFVRILGVSVVVAVATAELVAELRPQVRSISPWLAALELNGLEGLAISLATVFSILLSPLPTSMKGPMTASAAVPILLTPTFGPLIASIGQFLAVTFTQRWIERRAGAQPTLEESALAGLRIEALGLVGGMGGSISGTALMGSIGWALGDTMGELLGVGLAITLGRSALGAPASVPARTPTPLPKVAPGEVPPSTSEPSTVELAWQKVKSPTPAREAATPLPFPPVPKALWSEPSTETGIKTFKTILRIVVWGGGLLVAASLLKLNAQLEALESPRVDPRQAVFGSHDVHLSCGPGLKLGGLVLQDQSFLFPTDARCASNQRWSIWEPSRALDLRPERVLAPRGGFVQVTVDPRFRYTGLPLGDFTKVNGSTKARVSRRRESPTLKVAEWLGLSDDEISAQRLYSVPAPLGIHLLPGTPLATDKVIGIFVAGAEEGTFLFRPINYLYDEGILTPPPDLDVEAWNKFKSEQ